MMNSLDSIFEFFLYPFVFLSIYFQVFMLYNFLSNKQKMRDEENVSVDYFPTVTFLLPGWNEAKNILITIKSLQDLNYPHDRIRIFYLDNNSTDNTRELVESLMKSDSRIRYYFETKQGKHHALNTGLRYVETDLVACLDVDSTLHIDAMAIAAQYFKDSEIQALASCMQLRDVRTIWQKTQFVEYLLSIFWRKAYSVIDAVQVMPGPFSVFRSSVFTELGNYRAAHNAEDFEMTLRLHKNHYKIANAHKAYVYTVGPDTLRGLLKQRVRWFRGFLANAWDYRDMFFKKKYGHFGVFTLPVASISIFYILYAFSYTLVKTLEMLYIKLDNYLAIGLHVPVLKVQNVDLFYISTDIFMIQTIFIFTLLAFVLRASRDISGNRDRLGINFVIYITVYPTLVSIFLTVAVYKFLTNARSDWALQDNKI